MSDIPYDFDYDVYRIVNNFNGWTNEELKEHWIKYGNNEGRIYKMPIGFDYNVYKKSNGFYDWIKNDIIHHWFNHGQHEGRIYRKLPNGFNINYYKSINDFNNMTDTEIIHHWFNHGQYEGRKYNESGDITLIEIVYFIWVIDNRNWKLIIDGQLDDIVRSDILDVSKLNIIITSDNNINLINECKNHICDFLNNKNVAANKYVIDIHNENRYEYEGITKLYELGRAHPERLYIYLHSKGMYHQFNNNPNKRWDDEFILTQETIYNWMEIVDIFKNNSEIQKVGYIAAKKDGYIQINNREFVAPTDGWMWFNFYWVRGEYLNKCNKPIVTDDRYYYELWLGTNYNGILNERMSYSLYSRNQKEYSQRDAIHIILKARGITP